MRARHFGALLLSSLIGPCGSVGLRVVPASPNNRVACEHEVLARAPRMVQPTTWVQPARPATRSAVAGATSLPSDSSAHLPLTFIENAGQWDTRARFVARDGGRTLRVEPDALVLQLEECNCHESPRGEVLRLTFEQANSAPVVVGEGRLPGDHNFIRGQEPSGWITGVGGYASVLYQALYPGVDVRLHEREGQLEYDLVLAPEAALAAVALRCEGADGLEIDRDGALVMQTPLVPIRQSPPVAWEESESGDRHPLACRYRLI